MSNDIWCGTPIPILGVTGEPGCGKTLFLSGIDPANTFMIDVELSSATYNIPFKRRADLYQSGAKTPKEQFEWFLKEVNAIQPGEFSVLAVDPLADLENGLVDYVASRYADYGLKSEQAFTNTGGIFWTRVKEYYKDLLAKITGKVQTLAFSVHLKNESKGQTRTGRRIPEGKVTLVKLASLFLMLKKQPNERKPPTGEIIKGRLSVTQFNDGELKVIPILPDALPEATPNAIREYIKNPVGLKAKLGKGEVLHREEMSDEDKLILQREIAADQLAAEELKTARAASMQEAAAEQRRIRDKEARKEATPTPTTKGSVKHEPEKRPEPVEAVPFAVDPPAEANPLAANPGTQGGGKPAAQGDYEPSRFLPAKPDAGKRIDDPLGNVIMEQVELLKLTGEQWAAVLEKRRVKNVFDLNEVQACELYRNLWSKLTKLDLASELGKP